MSLSLEDSTSYQFLVNRGEVREAQAVVLRFGGKRFGPAPEAVQAVIRGIGDLEVLRRLADRVFEVSGWDELLAGR
jgi:hypothetical protein